MRTVAEVRKTLRDSTTDLPQAGGAVRRFARFVRIVARGTEGRAKKNMRRYEDMAEWLGCRTWDQRTRVRARGAELFCAIGRRDSANRRSATGMDLRRVAVGTIAMGAAALRRVARRTRRTAGTTGARANAMGGKGRNGNGGTGGKVRSEPPRSATRRKALSRSGKGRTPCDAWEFN